MGYWAQVGYFDTAAETKPLLHLWSLGIEEQFYILWPAILLLAYRLRANLLAVTAGLALLSYLVNVGGRLMCRDTQHLSYDGDLLVGKRFAEWLQARPNH